MQWRIRNLGMLQDTPCGGWSDVPARDLSSRIHIFWNKEELPKQWKESIIVQIYKKSDETDCSNYWGILPTFLPSFLSALQLRVRFGLLNNQPPSLCSSFVQTMMRHTSLEVKSICIINYWGSLVCFSIEQHSSDTGEKMGVQWYSILAIHRLQEILWFS
jgi:hypothetical protein